jgi:hypothetical protein
LKLTKQLAIIIGIIATGFIISSIAYAQTTVTDTSITTQNLNVTGTCTGCGGGSAIVNYTGNGSTSPTFIRHNLGTLPTTIYITDLNDSGTSSMGVTTLINTKNYVTIISGNDNYAPFRLVNNNIVNSTSVDVGSVFNSIQTQSNAHEANYLNINYQLVAKP